MLLAARGVTSPAVPSPVDRAVADVDTWDSITRSRRRTGPACAGCCGTPPPTCSRSTAPARASPTRACCWRSRGSAASPCVLLGQDRRGQTDAHPLGPGGAARGPARHAAGRRARPAAGHRDRHPRRRAVEGGRGGRAGRRDRPLPGRPGHARRAHAVACCSARAPAAGRSRCCPPTGCSRPSTPGCRRCRPRAPARSCTATSTTPPRWPAQGVALAGPARRRHRRPDRRRAARRRRRAGGVLRAGSARCCATSSPRCSRRDRADLLAARAARYAHLPR